VSVALGIQHALHMHHIVICYLPGYTIFFHIVSQPARFFGGEKKLSNIKFVFWFSLQLLSETFVILRRTERDIIKMYTGVRVKYRYSCPILMKFDFSQHIFEKMMKYEMLWKCVQWKPCCSMRTDGQTDMTKLTVAFSNFANAAKSPRLPQTTQLHFFESQFDQLQMSVLSWFVPLDKSEH